MGHHKLFYQDAKAIREMLNDAIERARKIQEMERELVKILFEIDQKKFYVRYGFRSLNGFCRFALKFSKTQSQRITIQVRRSLPTVNIVDVCSPEVQIQEN